MAKPANILLVKQILTRISITENTEKCESQSSAKILDSQNIANDSTQVDVLENHQKFLDEPVSALLPKKRASASQHPSLNIIPTRSQGLSGSFSTAISECYIDQPESATLLPKGKKLFDAAPESEYTACYERAEVFLDENDVKFAEPGAESKVRKHVKVLTRAKTLQEEHSESPLYVGSPSLRNICDSSLLARRINSKEQSPMSQKSTFEEDSPLSMSKTSSINHTSPIPQKISKFGGDSRKNSVDSGIFEEEKAQYNFHVPPEVEILKTRSKEINTIYVTNKSVIHEVTEPSTPLLPSILKGSTDSTPSNCK